MTTGGQDPNQNPERGPGPEGTPPPGNYPPPPSGGTPPPPGNYPGSGGGYPPPPGNYPGPGGGYPPPPGNYPGPGGGYPPPPGNYPPPPPVQGGYGDAQWTYGTARPGGLGLRFLARFIDGLLVAIVSLVIAIALAEVSNVFVTGVVSGALTFAYFVTFEVTMGGTPAKKMLGLSVTAPGGHGHPSLQQSAVRNAFTLFPVIPIVGGLLAFISYIVIAVTISNSPTNQGKHDALAGGTQVLKS
ncbi:RDD family protein [Nocardiaceae bacterium NPDC056970]